MGFIADLIVFLSEELILELALSGVTDIENMIMPLLCKSHAEDDEIIFWVIIPVTIDESYYTFLTTSGKDFFLYAMPTLNVIVDCKHAVMIMAVHFRSLRKVA